MPFGLNRDRRLFPSFFDCPVWEVKEARGVGDDPFDSPPVCSYKLPIGIYGPFLTVFELLSWLQKRFRPSVHSSDLDAMTNTALEATASSSSKNGCRAVCMNVSVNLGDSKVKPFSSY